ncbi:MAG: isoprenylcysteine carboxylmethyltransferase family protein [Candidatus Acidiferrales bacterium]
MTLKSRLALRFLLALGVLGALLFIPAGSLRFWQGWAYIAITFGPGLFAFTDFYKHDPQLIERRMQLKEKVREQKRIMVFVYIMWLIAFVLPGLDHRFGWSHLPLWITVFSQAVIFGGFVMTLWVVKVNRFAARTIQVEPGQEVISHGPYRIVRHPMYLGACAMWLFTPLALGSYFTLPAFVLLIPLIVLRLLNEEKVLRQELPGYPEYCLHTRFRLVPFLW